jgi:Fe-S-cluster containining protein
VTPGIVRMVGTDATAPRCIALAGDIGREVACTIYAARPSPCREFEAGDEACVRARRRHGLPAP